jgi:hypothetical protein
MIADRPGQLLIILLIEATMGYPDALWAAARAAALRIYWRACVAHWLIVGGVAWLL